ncbi:hypothetical protein CI238_12923 [Colletotrichum incanum]|uniref:Uncharacterized protein n=1 Tax=Colletotrichum incanum TaxID=1573173 RepID=A0A167DFK0_COLIC|nr:hypothetical protein CI238_12923 [Colletotrichum incanum]
MAVNQILDISDSQGMANVGKSWLLEHIKIDASDPAWYDVRWLAAMTPEARDAVKVLEVGSTFDNVPEKYMDFFCRVVPQKLGQKPHHHDDSAIASDDCIVDYLLWFLDKVEEVRLRLYGYGDYFANLRHLPALQKVEIDISNTPHARYSLPELFGLFHAAPAVREVRIVHTLAGAWDAELMPHLLYLEKIEFVNCDLCEKEIRYISAKCPKLRIFKYSVKYEPGNDPPGAPLDVLESLKPLNAQLEELELSIGHGSPFDDQVRIDSLGEFPALRAVLIAWEFIADLPSFLNSLPRSVVDLTVIGGDMTAREALQRFALKEGTMTVKHNHVIQRQ